MAAGCSMHQFFWRGVACGCAPVMFGPAINSSPFVINQRGYIAAMVNVVPRRLISLWGSIVSSPVLTLNGWVAFNLPRTVTALGGSLLMALVAVHAYVLITFSGAPLYFAVYSAVLGVCCLTAAAAMVFALKPRVPQAGWYLGSLICLAFLAIYIVSRWVSLPGLEALTGRWDLSPGTFAFAFAAGFVAVHATVLSGINVAYPHRQQWYD